MKSVFDACRPRKEVLEGELSDDIFAARLRDVMEGTADPVYGDAGRFFDNTFPTLGLRDLLTEALGRLTGRKAASSPIIRLETAFGGGKTHNLIALYHAARSSPDAKLASRFVDPSLLPKAPIQLVAGVVGSDMEPAAGRLDKKTGIKTYTLAGEIALQLRGKEGYEIVADADRGRNAVGTGTFEQLIGNDPCLIMLDELGRFLRDASSVPTPANPKVMVADTSVATLMALLEFAASRANVVVVLTLADSKDAFGKETEELRRQLANEEARKLSARQERVLTPSNEAEMSSIVTHRLFHEIDRKAAKEAAETYARFYEDLRDRDADFALPDRVRRAEYRQEIEKDYPFHPTFLSTLRRKTSTIPSFQQTRGALRLLARSVRTLWQATPKGTHLLHIHHLDLGNDDIANELTSRLDRPQFKQVIEADLASPRKGKQAHCQELDEARRAEGKAPYAFRLASSIFVHSLTQGVASGVDQAELAETVFEPGDEPAYLRRVLGQLEDECWFLDYDGSRLRFKTEASINKIIADEAQGIPTTLAKRALMDRIRSVWRSGALKPLYEKSDPSEVDDDAQSPKLVVIHFDAARAKEGDEQQAPPELVARLFEHSGTQEGYRRFKNNVLFLVADEDHVDRMIDQMRRFEAIAKIVGDAQRMNEFNKEQRDKLSKFRDAAELDVRVAITRAYRFLFYPSEDAPKRCRGLRRHGLPAQDQGDVKKDQAEVVLRALKSLSKVLTSDDQPKAAAWLKAKAWPHGQAHVTTEEIRQEFARRIGLPILLDPGQLKRTIKNGIENGEWIYYSAAEEAGYGKASPPPLVSVGPDSELWEPEAARQQGIRTKGEEPPGPEPKECPVCLQWPCACGEELDGGAPGTVRLFAEGAPAQAFQSVHDQCQEHKVSTVRALLVSASGEGPDGAKELKSLGLAIPQLGKGSYSLNLALACEYGDGQSFTVDFKGGWDRYKRLKQVTDAFAGEASRLTMRAVLRAEFPDGLEAGGDQFETIMKVFSDLHVGKITLQAEPMKESEPSR